MPLVESFITKLAATIGASLVTYGAQELKDYYSPSERKKALEACTLAGAKAIEEVTVQSPEKREQRRIEGAMLTFFQLPATIEHLEKLLLGKPLDRQKLWKVFAASEAAKQVPKNFDFRAALDAFETVFLRATVQQAVLQGEIAAAQSLLQTDLQRQIRDRIGNRHAEVEAGRRRYLETLSRLLRSLPLDVFKDATGPAGGVTLNDVFIDLDTTTRRLPAGAAEGKGVRASRRRESLPELAGEPDPKAPPLTAWEVAEQEPYLALLGDPGGGKSSFVKELLARKADALQVDSDPAAGLLPVYLELRHLAEALQKVSLAGLDPQEAKKRLAQTVLGLALRSLEKSSEGEENPFTPVFEQAFSSGRCLLVLDGLDEVASARVLTVRQAVEAVFQIYRPQRVIVTCRIRSWSGDAVLEGFAVHRLAPLDKAKITGFAHAWYQAQQRHGRFTAAEAERRSQDLARAALEGSLRELAANPMLLTSMAVIHQQNTELPRQRVTLYERIVWILLHRWQKEKEREEVAASDLDQELASLRSDERRCRRLMERLAWEVHRRQVGSADKGGSGEAGVLDWGDAMKLLRRKELLGSPALAAAFLDYVDQRAGLLVGRGGEPGQPAEYGFPHRTFQEYLAGCYMTQQDEAGDAWGEYLARAAEGEGWSLAAQLGAEDLLYRRDSQGELLQLIYLLGRPGGRSLAQRRGVLWAARMVELVGPEVIERDTRRGGRRFLTGLRTRLAGLLDSRLKVLERVEAGRILGRLGDPRGAVTTLEAMQFCYVPPGDFLWGSNLEKRTVAHGYWISQFPITQAQYTEFVAAGGYQDGSLWKEAKAAGVWERGRIKDYWNHFSENGPQRYGEPYDLKNHPVVGVTWYEALAFTRWLTARLRTAGLPEPWQVLLPTESEWEKAARGGVEVPRKALIRPLGTLAAGSTPEPALEANAGTRRIYSWGDAAPTPEHANYSETGVGSTSAVGCFPRSASPYGCEEVAGNVWEWCQDYEGDPSARGLRGGSWFDPAQDLALGLRFRIQPSNRDRVVGFRVSLCLSAEP